MAQVTRLHVKEVTVGREGQVAKSDEGKDAITNLLDLSLLATRNGEGRGQSELFPAQASVDEKNTHATDVEQAPTSRSEEVKFQLVDVTHWHWLNSWIVDPKELELEDTPEVD